MRWPRFLHRRQIMNLEDSLDVDEVLAAGLKDPSAARRSIDRLRRERRRLERAQRALNAQRQRRTPRELRAVGRAGLAASEMGVFQLSQPPTEVAANDARGEQLATLEARLEAINDALVLLNTYLREPH